MKFKDIKVGDLIVIKNDITYGATGIMDVETFKHTPIRVDKVGTNNDVRAQGYNWNIEWIDIIVTKETKPEYFL